MKDTDCKIGARVRYGDAVFTIAALRPATTHPGKGAIDPAGTCECGLSDGDPSHDLTWVNSRNLERARAVADQAAKGATAEAVRAEPEPEPEPTVERERTRRGH